jgi:fumarate reductase subunit D
MRGPRNHRNHRAYWAFVGHRLSGLALAVFLPCHFLFLGLAVEAAVLDAALAWTEFLLVKIAEWGLVTLLALHLLFGLRLLALELLPWPGGDARLGWILPGLAASVVVGLVFLAGAL